MPDSATDVQVLRELTKRYAELAALPIQEERRRLWRDHLSLKPTRTPVIATYGMWNVWCRELWGDHALRCTDGFYREHERALHQLVFHHSIGDDFVLEPWITQAATKQRGWGEVWGVKQERRAPGREGGAWMFDPPVKDWADVKRLSWPPHVIDEAATARNVDRLRDAVGDLIEVNVDRGPVCQGFLADISTCLAGLRGLEQVMVDMVESPDELHALLAFMRDGILANQEAAEQAGDFSLTAQHNQSQCYAEGLEAPRANSGPRRRRDLWGFCAAQEFALVSPAMHDEFLFQYQLPIVKHFGLLHYGCCEDLTHKIAMLRRAPNLRSIAVAPRADLRRCAEQIGRDYVIAWRPNPSNMVCAGYDEALVRRTIREAADICRGLSMHIHLKDVETVEQDPGRLARWARATREASA